MMVVLGVAAIKVLLLPVLILVGIFGISAFGITWSIISNAKLVAIIIALIIGAFILMKLRK